MVGRSSWTPSVLPVPFSSVAWGGGSFVPAVAGSSASGFALGPAGCGCAAGCGCVVGFELAAFCWINTAEGADGNSSLVWATPMDRNVAMQAEILRSPMPIAECRQAQL